MLKRYLHLFTAWKQPLHFLQLTILFHLLANCIYKISRVRTDQSFNNSWKSLEICPFPDPEKVWKIGVSLDKMVKRLDDQVLHKWNVFVLVKIFPSGLHVMNKALFLRFFKVSVNHLFDNLESGKRNYCFFEKVLNFGSNESVQTLISTCILVNLINL